MDTHYSTGGAGAKMSAFTALDPAHRIGYGIVGVSYMPTDVLLGGLDAPSQLPAGAMNSTEWVNGRGEPLPRQTMTTREQ